MLNFKKYLLALATALLPTLSFAGDFSAIVSPTRFEAEVKSGHSYKDIIEITNNSHSTSVYNIKTNDWNFSSGYDLVFHDDLTENSCRPWVVLESSQITLAPGATKRFRFEVQVPENSKPVECKFVILVEGDEPYIAKGNLSVPVSGRVGVITYLAVDGAKPDLKLLDVFAEKEGDSSKVSLKFKNEGSAHGRLLGFVDIIDAGGNKYSSTPTTMPILSGEERIANLTPIPKNKDDAPPVLLFPLKLEGKLYWNGGELKIDREVKL